ncbi:hypothetical protein WN51_06697 [Melipona quadrifasciata]|uniref:Uncharacterized protein n=1 Tax=Melipona quadrifasciata TaxID=166423 RepID=A0A0N1IU51_9HYME|nr:hypothetical protein WN51_06697 [Melipona quadrifasciata]
MHARTWSILRLVFREEIKNLKIFWECGETSQKSTVPGAINIPVDRSEGSKGVVNHDKSNCRVERGSERLTSSGWPEDALTAGKHGQLNRRIFIASSVIGPGGASSTRRTFRDFHNDEPKSVACTADMLLAAITASVRPGIEENFKRGRVLANRLVKDVSVDDARKKRKEKGSSERKIERARFSKSSFGVGLNVVQKKLNFFHVLVAGGNEAAQKPRDS